MRRRSTVAAALVTVLLQGSPARAQGSQAAAQALFDEARRLMAEGKYADACPKFADSEKLDPAPGTLLNLAKCYEKNGQSASAWVTYKDAESVSKKSGHADWATMARERAALLEPKLVRLTITVPPTSEVEGLQLSRDGNAVARSEWNTPIPVDPGNHTIEANAPNTHKWSTSLAVEVGTGNASVTIPQLEVERPQVATPPPPETTPAPNRGTPSAEGSSHFPGLGIAGITVGAIGVAGIAVGTVFGLRAKSKNNEALEPQNCPTSTLCDSNGLSLTHDAKNAATLSTVFFIVGGAALATGVVLVAIAPYHASASPTRGRDEKTLSAHASLVMVPALAPGGGGLTMVGRW